MKKVIFFVLFFSIIIFSLYPAYAAYDMKESKVYLNGKYLDTVALEILNGRAFAPVSLFQEAFGFAISWDRVNQVIVIEDTVGKGDTPYSTNHYWWAIMVNSYALIENNPKNGKWTTAYLDEMGYYDPPIMGSDDKVYVPLRLFMQIMGGDVDYNKGDINFNLPQAVLEDIKYRTNSSNATGGEFTASSDLVKSLNSGF